MLSQPSRTAGMRARSSLTPITQRKMGCPSAGFPAGWVRGGLVAVAAPRRPARPEARAERWAYRSDAAEHLAGNGPVSRGQQV